MEYAETIPEQIREGAERRVVNVNNLMMVLVDLHDGPTNEPDPPQSHPHEQVAYVAEGEVLVIVGEKSARLGPGDVFVIPSDGPHSIQQLTKSIRLVDCFTPIRKDFI